jgi:hypothetical protein
MHGTIDSRVRWRGIEKSKGKDKKNLAIDEVDRRWASDQPRSRGLRREKKKKDIKLARRISRLHIAASDDAWEKVRRLCVHRVCLPIYYVLSTLARSL